MSIPPYRVTPEDLPELDKKTREGLRPLLDALNITVQQLVAADSAKFFDLQTSTLVVGAAVADSFPYRFKHALGRRPIFIGMTLRPRDEDHVLTDPWVMQGWSLTEEGLVSVPWITGLLPSNSYDLTFLIL